MFSDFLSIYHNIDNKFFQYVGHTILALNEKHWILIDYKFVTFFIWVRVPSHHFYASHHTLIITYYAHIHTTRTPTRRQFHLFKNL